MRTAPTDLGTSCPKVEQGKRAAPPKVPPFCVSPTGQGRLSVILLYRSGRRPTWKILYPSRRNTPIKLAKFQFIVTPVYKDKGESMRDILLKLMLADLEPA